MLAHLAEIRWLPVIAGTLVYAVLGGLYFMMLVPRQYIFPLIHEKKQPNPRR